MNREKTIKEAVYKNWFKEPKESHGFRGRFGYGKRRKWVPHDLWLKYHGKAKES